MQLRSLAKQGLTGLLTASVLNILLGAFLVFGAEASAQAQNQNQPGVFQSASARGAQPETSLDRARRLYRARRYSEAANLFRQAVQKDGAGAVGYLSMAHCQYAMGHLQEAVLAYRHVRDAYGGSAESKVAAQYLTRLDLTGRAQRSGVGAAGSSSAIVSCAGAGAGSSSSIQEGIEIVKPVIGHPELSPATVALVKANLNRLPTAVQNILVQRGVKVCITPTLVDKFPALGYLEGRGYDGHTYKSCPGMFKDNTVIICERFVDENSNEVQAPIPPGQITDTVYHEIGHAIDACLNSYCTTDEYRHAYYLDIARIPPDAAGRLAYYMQKSVAGQQESCGEIMAVCFGGGERTAQDIKTYFPMTMALIKKKLNTDKMIDDSQGQIAGRSTSHHM